jgi:hypothetical protein
LLLIVITIVGAVNVLRWALTEDMTYYGIDFAGPVCSGLNAI